MKKGVLTLFTLLVTHILVLSPVRAEYICSWQNDTCVFKSSLAGKCKNEDNLTAACSQIAESGLGYNTCTQFTGTCDPIDNPPPPPPSDPSDPSDPTDVFCGDSGLGVNTALGCFMAGDPKQAVSQILGWAIIVGGGIAFLIIIYAGFQISTAQGDPKKMQAANELLTSAVSGLILIIFSIVILNVIGVSVLGLDQFGFNL